MADHEAGVKEARERMTFRSHSIDHRANHLFHHDLIDIRRHHGGGGVGTHAAGVRSLVVVKQTLVVLGGCHRNHMLTVAGDDEGGFLAIEEVFDNHARAGGAEAVAFQHVIDSLQSFFNRHCHDHALAGSKTVSFDDDRSAVMKDVLAGGLVISKGLILSRRNAVALHKGLREILGRLKLRGSLRRSKDLFAALAEDVHDARGKRCLGADHRVIDTVFAHEFQETFKIRRLDGNVREKRIRIGPSVAGGNVNRLNMFALSDTPGKSMLATAAADNQNFHRELHSALML